MKEQIEEWERNHGKSFTVGGKRFVDFIETQRQEYMMQKENEKTQRVCLIFKLFNSHS